MFRKTESVLFHAVLWIPLIVYQVFKLYSILCNCLEVFFRYDWAKEFIWSLKHLEEWVWRTSSEGLRLKKWVWRRAPEDTSSEARTSEALIIRSISRQKLLHQSWQRTVYEVYGHELCNHLLCNLCRCNKTKIIVTLLQTLFLLFWNGFEVSSS